MPLFYFTLNVKSLYNRQQSLLRKLPTNEQGSQTYPIWVLVKIMVIFIYAVKISSVDYQYFLILAISYFLVFLEFK